MAKTPQEVTADYVVGTQDNDLLYETASTYVMMYGYGGDDLFVAAAAADNRTANTVFFGGSGTDTISYVNSATRISADLATGYIFQQWPSGGNWETDYAYDIENLRGTLLPDHVEGSAVANVLWGDGGDDHLEGREGDDTLDGGNGADSLHGGSGDDLLLGGAGNDILLGGAEDDTQQGGDGSDALYGEDGADSLAGGEQNDLLLGGDGNDTLDGGSGDDVIAGGGGIDTLRHVANGDVQIDLNAGTSGGALGSDLLDGVENVVTGSGHDSIRGSDAANRIEAGAGNDRVEGLIGNDTIDGGSGNDEIYGQEGADSLSGGSGHDELLGGSGNDTLLGGSGRDTLNGSTGNDVLDGGTGPNLLIGGAGNDSITCGTDADTLRWEHFDLGTDVVTGFDLAEDRISFGATFFTQPIGGAVEPEDVLLAYGDGAGGSYLAADAAGIGWTVIARLFGVGVVDLDAMIESGSILAASVGSLGDGAGGGGLLG